MEKVICLPRDAAPSIMSVYLKVKDRFEYVCYMICKTYKSKFNFELSYKQFKDLYYCFDDDAYFIEYRAIEDQDDEPSDFIDKEGESVVFSDYGFPKRWLFEDFEDELKNGYKKMLQTLKKHKKEELSQIADGLKKIDVENLTEEQINLLKDILKT